MSKIVATVSRTPVIRTLVPSIAVAIAVSACGGHSHTIPRSALVTFGHSYVAGGAAVIIRPTWTSRAAHMLHLAGEDRGVNGATSQQVLTVVAAYRVRARDDVVLEPEINDVRRGLGAAFFAHNLRRMLDHLEHAAVTPHRVLVLFDPRPIRFQGGLYDTPGLDKGSDAALARYTAAGETIVKQFPGVLAYNLEPGWNSETLENHVDTLHPNNAGVQRIADVVTAELR